MTETFRPSPEEIEKKRKDFEVKKAQILRNLEAVKAKIASDEFSFEEKGSWFFRTGQELTVEEALGFRAEQAKTVLRKE